ncbi:MAG TPA: adenylate/guanylate cyclase domain-containing protein, partial [Leptospiraceae bacterium]|nr:adenylate/guanylate cyclase domain-containing protein [Leptospiraceae bacterium]
MDTYHISPYPELTSNIDSIQYFWHMLPYAVPGFITFFCGLILALIGFFRVFSRKEKTGYYLSFSGMCLAFGMLGFVLALRAVIHDTEILLRWNTVLYTFILLYAPSSAHLIYYILDKKYKIALVGAGINWIATLFAFYGIVTNQAFTGNFLQYSFGIYPIASIYLKAWGIIGAATFFFLGVPTYAHYLKRNSFYEKRFLVIGHILSILLVISNLPSFMGIPLFPGSTFAFIPMLLLAYGIFLTDFSDLRVMLFEKNGFFYVLNLFASLVLLLIAIAVIFFFSPLQYQYQSKSLLTWQLIPLISVLLVVGLGIFIGGSNPHKPLNQMGAFSLYLYGFQLLASISIGLSPDPMVGHRIEQLCFLLFCFAPSIQSRFAFLSFEKKIPKFFILIDIASFLLAVLALSPYLFVGYYNFPWGRFSASGPVIHGLGMVGFIAMIFTLNEWNQKRKRKEIKPIGNFAVFYLATGAIMLLFNIPATMGIPLYPLGNLSIFPTMILVYAIVRYGESTINTESFRISSYLVPFALGIVIFILCLVWVNIPREVSFESRLFHLFISGVPLILLSFLSTFILIRPIAARVDKTLESLRREKEITEKQKMEIEIINDYSKKLNSKLDLDKILDEIFEYFDDRYSIEGIIIQFLDKEKNEFYSYKTTTPENAAQEIIDYSQNLRLPFDERLGILFSAYKKLRTLYVPRVVYNLQPPIIQDMINALRFQNFLFVPLIIQDEVIGSMFFTSYRKRIDLSKTDISNISIFCNQISTSIQNSKLFKQVKEEKEKALEAKLEAEKAKFEVEILGDFAKLVNSENILDHIFSYAVINLIQNLNADIFWLQLVDKNKNELYTRCISNSGNVPEVINKFKAMRIPLSAQSGSIYLTYKRKKILYISDISKTRSMLSEIDKSLINEFNLKSAFQIPLLINDEVIGILHINKLGGMKKLTQDDIRSTEALCEQLGIAINKTALYEKAELERRKSENLLLNILPKDVASELKEKGAADPVQFDSVSVLFTDFQGFTTIAERMKPNDLIKELDACFIQFDRITERCNLEKLKTIGDSYMCAGGIPRSNKTHAIDCVLAAMQMQDFMKRTREEKTEQGVPYWEIRLGIHSGPLVAGVIGEKKFA